MSAARKTAKKSVKKSGKKSGELVAQPHGGAIRNGSEPGNTPGTGRPPSEVKRRALKAFDEKALPVLEDLAVTAAKDKDKIAAAAVLAKTGLSDAVSKTEVRKALAATLEDIRKLVPDRADIILASVRPHWTAL